MPCDLLDLKRKLIVVQERQKKMAELKTEFDDVYERLTRVTGELAQTVSLIIHHGRVLLTRTLWKL